MAGLAQVGTLYRNGFVNGLKVWTQPGGPGTQVFPAVPSIFPAQNMGYPQVVMSYPALYYSGCGHPLNCWEVQEEFSPESGDVAALLLCPLCQFVQAIYDPASLYYDYIDTPIVVA